MSTRNYLHADNTLRFCSRCHDSLTDPASRERGVGPVCMKQDAHLYAKTIPTDYALAYNCIIGLNSEQIHADCHETLETVKSEMTKLYGKLTKVEGKLSTKLTGGDFRNVVRGLDFMCSFTHPTRDSRMYLVECVRALGYVGLAAVLDGQASTSPSKLYFKDGRVYLECLGNKSGWLSMRKIPGVLCPRYRGDRTPYSVPAGQAKAFCAVAMVHWPMYDGDITEICKLADEFVRTLPKEVATVVAESTGSVMMAKLSMRSEDFVLSFPWVKTPGPGKMNMYDFLAGLKALPSKERSYDAVKKTWSFKPNHFDAVAELCRRTFEHTSVEMTLEETPENAYVRVATGYNPYPRHNMHGWYNTSRYYRR